MLMNKNVNSDASAKNTAIGNCISLFSIRARLLAVLRRLTVRQIQNGPNAIIHGYESFQLSLSARVLLLPLYPTDCPPSVVCLSFVIVLFDQLILTLP